MTLECIGAGPSSINELIVCTDPSEFDRSDLKFDATLDIISFALLFSFDEKSALALKIEPTLAPRRSKQTANHNASLLSNSPLVMG